MKMSSRQNFKRFLGLFLSVAVFAAVQIQAASLSPKIESQLNTLADNVNVGMTIVAFNAPNGLKENHLNILRNLGINAGYKFNTLGMVAMPLNAGQIRALNNNPN